MVEDDDSEVTVFGNSELDHDLLHLDYGRSGGTDSIPDPEDDPGHDYGNI